MMEKYWGKIVAPKGDSAAVRLPDPTGGGKFSLSRGASDLRLGTTIAGTVPQKDDWKGRPIMLYFWSPRGIESMQAIERAEKIQLELQDFKFIILGTIGADEPRLVEPVGNFVKARGFTHPMVLDAEGRWTEEFPFPHAVVYDRNGKCVYRGTPLDAEPYLRRELVLMVKEKLGKESWAKPSEAIFTAIEKSEPIPAVMTKLNAAISDSVQSAPELRAIRDALTEGGAHAVQRAKSASAEDPFTAYLEHERVATAYRGTPVAKSANDEMSRLKSDRKVERELKARTALESVRKLDKDLAGKKLAFDPTNPEFRENNAGLLRALGEAVERLRKNYAGTKAAGDAALIATHWRIRIG